MSIFDGRDDPLELDTVGEVSLTVALAVLFGMFLGALYFAANPTLDEEIRYRFSQPDLEQKGGTIQFSMDQIREMNKVYRDKREEYAWCLSIDDDEVVDMAHPPRVQHNNETRIHFVCDRRSTNGILHTHPGLLAVPELSETDKRGLQNSDLQVSCVLSEAIPERHWNQNPPSLNCFNQDLEKMNIEILDTQ